MAIRVSSVASVTMCASTLLMFAGCCTQPERTERKEVQTERTVAEAPPRERSLGEWPADAEPGQCYAKAFVPPQTTAVQERVVIKEASERLEIVPAQYEWVEERVMIKDGSKQLVEVPAEYTQQQQTVVVQPAQSGWFMDSSGNCRTTDGQPVKDVYCLINRPAVTKTISTQKVVRSASTKEIDIPAEYQTVRRQKLIAAATTRKVTVPAEYDTVESTVVTAPGRWEWQRVICDTDSHPLTINALKGALMASGFQPGPFNGQMSDADWAAVKAYQQANGLGVGNLSYETLDHLQVVVK